MEVEEAPEDLYFSTSSRRIRPSGPVPLTLDKGIPRSRAIFFAMGDAKIRSPMGRSGCESSGRGGPDCGAFEGVFSSALGGADSDFFSSLGGDADAALEASSSAPEISSPSSPMMAMAEPT